MSGISNVTGKILSEDEHLKQSITDILTTPIGSRVMRRDYGFDFSVLAAPQNRATIMRVFIATVEAIMKWEPRITITQIISKSYVDGKMAVEIIGKKVTGETVSTKVGIG